MIVQYKQHHRDDYRASEKIRVQSKNYIAEISEPELLFETEGSSGQMRIVRMSRGPNSYIVRYIDPCV